MRELQAGAKPRAVGHVKKKSTLHQSVSQSVSQSFLKGRLNGRDSWISPWSCCQWSWPQSVYQMRY